MFVKSGGCRERPIELNIKGKEMNAMKKTNAKKKLIPAAAMLAISAAMLSTATYAWFTMNKNAEVTGIQMTATVPEGLQISLGKGMNGTALENTASDDGQTWTITEPENTDAATCWSNSVSFSQYYDVGKLAPASSTTGGDIFYTKNATDVGRTISSTATFSSAINGNNKDKANTWAKPKTDATSTSQTLTDSGSDGYYIDFPVWFRNADSTEAKLKVTAVAKQLTSTGNLYKAARVSILSEENNTLSTLSNVILPKAAIDSSDVLAVYQNNKSNTAGTVASSGITDGAVDTTGTIGSSNTTQIYKTITKYDNTGIITVPAKTSVTNRTLYGEFSKYIVRVWLEGEDMECYNPNAGQDFALELHFDSVSS